MEDYSRVVNFLRNNSEYLTHNNFDGLFEAFSEAADPLGFCFGHVVDFFLIELKINILSYFSKLDRKMFTNSESPVLDFSKNTKITEIPGSCFENLYNLTSVNLPPSLTSIGGYAFYRCISLKNVTIPSSVTSLENFGFNGCRSLKSITVDEQNQYYSSENGVLFNKDKTVLLTYPAGNRQTSYEIPDGVTGIGEEAFYGCCKLTSITIPNSVTTIESGAFYHCRQLTSIAIPDGVTSIQSFTFDDCGNLTSIAIPSSVRSIDNYAFKGSYHLEDVYYGGTKAQWLLRQKIGYGNDPLRNSTIHFSK